MKWHYGILALQKAGQNFFQAIQVSCIISQAGWPGFYVIQFYQRLHINSFDCDMKAGWYSSKAFLDGKTTEWYV